jgi:nucleotide-binding universal stress UspA family protein
MLKIKKIVCPTDFSAPSIKGLAYAVEVAKAFGAELRVVYVLPIVPASATNPNLHYEIPEYERMIHKDSEAQLKAIIAKHVPKTVKAQPLIGHGNAAHEIVRLAGEEKADLVVIATHGHTGLHHLVVGSVAEKVVRLAPCPVLAIRELRR